MTAIQPASAAAAAAAALLVQLADEVLALRARVEAVEARLSALERAEVTAVGPVPSAPVGARVPFVASDPSTHASLIPAPADDGDGSLPGDAHVGVP